MCKHGLFSCFARFGANTAWPDGSSRRLLTWQQFDKFVQQVISFFEGRDVRSFRSGDWRWASRVIEAYRLTAEARPVREIIDGFLQGLGVDRVEVLEEAVPLVNRLGVPSTTSLNARIALPTGTQTAPNHRELANALGGQYVNLLRQRHEIHAAELLYLMGTADMANDAILIAGDELTPESRRVASTLARVAYIIGSYTAQQPPVPPLNPNEHAQDQHPPAPANKLNEHADYIDGKLSGGSANNLNGCASKMDYKLSDALIDPVLLRSDAENFPNLRTNNSKLDAPKTQVKNTPPRYNTREHSTNTLPETPMATPNPPPVTRSLTPDIYERGNRRHSEIPTVINGWMFLCERCGKRFTVRGDFEAHQNHGMGRDYGFDVSKVSIKLEKWWAHNLLTKRSYEGAMCPNEDTKDQKKPRAAHNPCDARIKAWRSNPKTDYDLRMKKVAEDMYKPLEQRQYPKRIVYDASDCELWKWNHEKERDEPTVGFSDSGSSDNKDAKNNNGSEETTENNADEEMGEATETNVSQATTEEIDHLENNEDDLEEKDGDGDVEMIDS